MARSTGGSRWAAGGGRGRDGAATRAPRGAARGARQQRVRRRPATATWTTPSSRCGRSGGRHPAGRQDREHGGGEEQGRDVAPEMPDLARGGEGVGRHHAGVNDARPTGEPDEAQVAQRIAGGEQQEDAPPDKEDEDNFKAARLLRLQGPL